MQRAITAFERDVEGHWVALLDCGHRQHVRHKPPFIERPWVVTAAGRRAHVGRALDCRLCDDGAQATPADGSPPPPHSRDC